MTSTKLQILDIAENLIRQYGLNGMSYKHISEAIGMQKASIHHHYPKKEDLVEALLNRCDTIYGNNYRSIVESNISAPEKLQQLADIFRDGLVKQQLCLVGTFSADLNSLQDNSKEILEKTIKNTVHIFSKAFKQGKDDGSLTFDQDATDVAYLYYSFLIGTQVSARAFGGDELFTKTAIQMIKTWIV
ncbi:MAG: TetR/AcrR family transcriptional regulator [Spirochaetaceae bacterium]